jgi:hypothetical protein
MDYMEKSRITFLRRREREGEGGEGGRGREKEKDIIVTEWR